MLHVSNRSALPSRAAVQQRGVWRRVACVAGLLALVLHLFSPNILRASGGEWIEICSSGGSVMMQVDLSDTGDTPKAPCPKCKHCTLCTLNVTVPPVADTITLTLGTALVSVTQTVPQLDIPQRRHQRPLSRAPPVAERSIMTTLVASSNTIGGAPWI